MKNRDEATPGEVVLFVMMLLAALLLPLAGIGTAIIIIIEMMQM